MNSNKVYQCPKCFNKLLYSNKMLHDLKCTRQRPADFSQVNPVASYRYNYNDMNYNNTFQNYSFSNSAGKTTFLNDDGTTTEIKRDKNMSGKEELLEITYDPQGNIIGRKKADGGISNARFNFHEIQEFNEYDTPYSYNVYEGNNEYVETIPTEVTYETVTYETPITNYQLPEHNFGSSGYSLMQSNIENINMVNVEDLNRSDGDININSNYLDNYYSNNTENTNTNNNSDYYSNNTYRYNNHTYRQNPTANLFPNNKYNTKRAIPKKFAKVTKLTKNNH